MPLRSEVYASIDQVACVGFGQVEVVESSDGVWMEIVVSTPDGHPEATIKLIDDGGIYPYRLAVLYDGVEAGASVLVRMPRSKGLTVQGKDVEATIDLGVRDLNLYVDSGCVIARQAETARVIVSGDAIVDLLELHGPRSDFLICLGKGEITVREGNMWDSRVVVSSPGRFVCTAQTMSCDVSVYGGGEAFFKH